MKKIILIVISVFVATSMSMSLASADESASIRLDPPNPEPRSVVTLTLESYSFNVNTAMITWKIGEKTVLEGEGEKKLTVKTGDVGDSTQVKAVAKTVDGSSIEQNITLTPSSVTLLYEAPKSYVPLLYEGRSLPGNGALVRITALPSMSDGGKVVAPSALSYSWYVGGKVLARSSGVNKQSLTINMDYLSNKTEVRVLVHSPYGNTSEKSITIYPHAIMPLLYTYDTILGPDFHMAIEKRFEAVKEFTLALEPFYVSDDVRKPATFVWYLDGYPTTPLGGRLLTMHPKEDSYGSRMLTINAFGSDKMLQKGQTQVELIFDTRK